MCELFLFLFSSFSFRHSRANGSQTWERLRITRHWLGATPEFCFSGSEVSQSVQSCPTLCDPMNRSTPGLPVHHQLPEFTQTHVHWVGVGLWTCILSMFLGGTDAVALGTTLWKPFYILMETSFVFTKFPLHYPTIIFASSSLSD